VSEVTRGGGGGAPNNGMSNPNNINNNGVRQSDSNRDIINKIVER
jgi:hypothetical protein